MTPTTKISALWRMALALSMLFAAVACSTDDGEEMTPAAATCFVDTQTTATAVPGYENTPRIQIAGKVGDTFTVTVREGTSWCWTSRNSFATSRTGTLVIPVDIIYLYVAANDADNATQREAVIEIEVGDSEPVVLTLEQDSYFVPATLDRQWAELPAYIANSTYIYTTHFAPVSGSEILRNYTICYDTEKRIANWVAYPLHNCYRQGQYTRTNAWAYDPNIPRNKQARIDSRSYHGGGVRGHQCMSYHRYSSYSPLLNEQTFYSTNIMPQDYNFNSGLWNDVENVTTKRICNDTLFLVTGTYGVMGWCTDNDGVKVAKPKYCWKVMLRTKSGRTGKKISEITSASDLQAIGFWAENASSSKGDMKEYLKSVGDIEQLTGYKFFPMIQPAIADDVKRQKSPADWGIY